MLKGTLAGSIPVYKVNKLNIFVNPKVASSQGLTIPQAVIDKADKVVE